MLQKVYIFWGNVHLKNNIVVCSSQTDGVCWMQLKTLLLIHSAWFLSLNVAHFGHCRIEHAKCCLCCPGLCYIRMSERVSTFPETLPFWEMCGDSVVFWIVMLGLGGKKMCLCFNWVYSICLLLQPVGKFLCSTDNVTYQLLLWKSHKSCIHSHLA